MLQVAQWHSSHVPLISSDDSITAYTIVSPFPPLLHDEPSIAIPNSVTVVDFGKLFISEPDGMFH